MVTTSYCRHCGADAAGSGRFCASCGYVLTPSGEQAVDRLLARLRDATVGEYDIVRQLGRGGMAAVYLAWDLDLARYVAIKVMFPELELQDGMAQRFLREARLAASLDDHPNVVRVYRARDVDGMRFFAMKYIDGCSLEQLLRVVGPLPIGIVCHVLDQVARALQYAHGRGIVHRDVKPSNVMLDRSGHAIVTDFGIARAAEGEQLTRTGFAIGTPAYMSPEQWRGEEFSAASDQYALGAVAYQMLTGQLPHGGTPYEMQEGHIRHAPTPLREARDDCPPMLASAVHRMLAKRPQDRWPDLSTVSTLLLDLADAPSMQLAAELSDLVPLAMPTDVDAESVTPHSPVVPARIVATGGEPGAAPAPPVATPTAAPRSTPVTPIRTAIAVPNAPAETGEPVGEAPLGDAPAADALLVDAPSLADTLYTPRATGPAPTIATGEVRRTPMGLPQISTTETHAAFALPETNPRRRRWIVGAAAVTLVGAVVFLLVTSGANEAGVVKPVAPPAASDSTIPAVSAGESRASAVDSGASAVDSGKTPPDTGALAAVASTDTARADTAVVGPPARIVISVRGMPADQHVPVGDSVGFVAQVLDANGKRVRSANVAWSARDTAGFVWHDIGGRRYAVARAPGGRLTAVATVGRVKQTLSVSAAPTRATSEAAGPSGSRPPTPASATPTVGEVSAALEVLQGLVRSGRLSGLDAPDGDAASAHDFVAWLAKADGIHVEGIEPLRNVSATGRGEAVADYAVRLSWRANKFSRKDAKTPVKLRLTFAQDAGTWRHTRTQLLERFTPK